VRGPSGRNTILQLRLLSFSTGLPHPLAGLPVIFIATRRLPLGDRNVLIEIVGDFLVLLITFLGRWNKNKDMIFLVRWKKGEAHCVSFSGFAAYSLHCLYHVSRFGLPKGEPTQILVSSHKTSS
jgi:hypothetical protein